MYIHVDTCTPKRTPVTLNVIGVEMLKIIYYQTARSDMNVGRFYQEKKIDLKVPEDYCIPVQGGVENCT
jgi:hypothetical protein